MRKKLLLLILILFSSNILFPQIDNGWMFMNPTPFGNSIYDLKFIDGNTGYALSRGCIMKTTNFGLNWIVSGNYRDSVSTEYTCIEKINETFYIGASYGILLKSTDGGVNFIKVNSGIVTRINDILFLNENTGFIGADLYFRKTTNAGQNWTNLFPSFTASIYELTFVNDLTGFASASGGRVYKTTNGGNNWFDNFIGVDVILNDIYMINSQTGYVCGDNGTLAKTLNGGNNWNILASGTTHKLTNIIFSNEFTGYVASNDVNSINYQFSKIRKTTNGGMIWSVNTELENSTILKSISVNGNKIMFAGIAGYLSYTINDNNITQITKYNIKSSIKAIKFINENSGIILNDTGQCLITSNGGIDWVESGVRSPNNFYMFDAKFVNLNTGFVSGFIPNQDDFLDLFKTTNAGLNWINVFPDTNDYGHISILNEQTYLVFNARGILKTTNSGLNWNYIKTNTIFPTETDFLNLNTGYAIDGDDRTIFKTTNGGFDWDTVFKYRGSNPYYIKSLSFANNNTGYIVISTYNPSKNIYYNFYKTTNGGQSWDSINIPYLGINYGYVKFITPEIGFVAGGRIFKTTNSGSNFSPVNFTTSNINKLYFYNNNIGFAYSNFQGAYYSAILKTTNGGTIFANNEIEFVNNYSLFQNYPNPFNPTTMISFNLNKPQFVTLKVYDITGREVQTLVNDIKKSGEHRVEFNAGKLSSGVYFYKIVSGEFMDVKKMILLK